MDRLFALLDEHKGKVIIVFVTNSQSKNILTEYISKGLKDKYKSMELKQYDEQKNFNHLVSLVNKNILNFLIINTPLKHKNIDIKCDIIINYDNPVEIKDLWYYRRYLRNELKGEK